MSVLLEWVELSNTMNHIQLQNKRRINPMDNECLGIDMADFLTDKNGVVCHSCFMTIDLTQIKFPEPSKWHKRLELFVGKRDWFRVTCPHCQKRDVYLYTEVRPISDLKRKMDELNKHAETTEPQFREWDN